MPRSGEVFFLNDWIDFYEFIWFECVGLRIFSQAEIDAERIGVGVTGEGQSIFDALCKT